MNNRLEAAAPLSLSEPLFRDIIDAVPVSIWVEDFSAVRDALNALAQTPAELAHHLDAHPELLPKLAGLVRVLAVNAATLEMMGATERRDLLRPLDTLFTTASYTVFRDELLAIASGRSAFESDMQMRTLDGRPLLAHLRFAVPGSPPDYSRVLVAISDITAQRNTEDALRRSEAQLRLITENVPAGIAHLDRNERVVYTNERFAALFGWRSQDALGVSARDVIGHADYATIHDQMRRAMDGETVNYTRAHAHPNGRIVHIDVWLVPARDATGDVDGVHALVQDVTEQRKAEEARLESETRLRIAIEATGLFDWEWDIATNELRWGRDPSPLLGPRGADGYPDFRFLVHPESRPAFLATRRAALDRDTAYDVEYRLNRTDGGVCWLSSQGTVLRDAGGNPLRMIGFARDITESKQRQVALSRSEALKGAMLASALDAIITMDHRGLVVEFNAAAEQCFGYTRKQAVGNLLADLIVPVHQRERLAEGLERLVETGRSNLLNRRFESRVLRSDGSEIDVEAAIVRIPGEDPPLFAGFVRDITERKRAEQRIQHLATRDALTALPNRALLNDRLEHALAKVRRDGGLLAVMYLDLDRFKDVNDTLGHQIGDALLKEAGQRLRGCLREGDTLARQGGDEFIVLLTNLSAQSHAALVAEKLLASLAQPCRIGDHEILASATIGIALHPNDGEDATTLLRNADTAMYHAKESGIGTYQFFTQSMNETARRRIALEGALRRTVKREEIMLFFQPQIHLATGDLVGFEALARWRHGHLGLVPPAQFIQLAEETGLILPLGEQVLRNACTEAVRWQRVASQPLRVAVNVSARQFRQRAFVDVIRGILKETGLPPTCLDLEITESTLMLNNAEAVTELHKLGEMGIQLTIDDFGTGYSSLSYLKRLPIDALKIDQSFIRDLLTDSEDASIVRAIAGLGQSLGLKVIAEGVEDEDQAAFLLKLGCELAQGYYFGVPVPPGQIIPYIKAPMRAQLLAAAPAA